MFSQNNISSFRKFLIKNFIKEKLDESKIINLYLDSVIAPSALNEDFFYDVEKLAPFGSGNNEPKFAIEKIKVISSKIIKNNHIKSTLIGKDGTVFNSFYWNGINTPIEEFLTGENKKEFNIAGKIKLNEWRGKKKVEFIIEDVLIN